MQICRRVQIFTDDNRQETSEHEERKRRIIVSLYTPGADWMPEQGPGLKYTALFEPCLEQAVGLLKDIGMNLELLEDLTI
ncbi:hypothetical protein B9T62_27900 [Paenibacillus donghaensis]|uniref:Uncharacterized protein n=1 Tax=Paenibacillus donghaensis TaxID=414771 RepID=A0A2Z2KTR7_9BACL|nr:hypothetical protein B9T62_27900 [Paenibacillus donghaensis]